MQSTVTQGCSHGTAKSIEPPASMRLDKWLKVARVIKRRTIANEVCDNGRATLNGRVAKASTEVKVGDALVIQFGPRKLALTVLEVPSGPVAASHASTLYRVDEVAPDLDLNAL